MTIITEKTMCVVTMDVAGDITVDRIKNWKGIALCFLLAVPAWLLGKQFEIIGGAVIAILLGMVITLSLYLLSTMFCLQCQSFEQVYRRNCN